MEAALAVLGWMGGWEGWEWWELLGGRVGRSKTLKTGGREGGKFDLCRKWKLRWHRRCVGKLAVLGTVGWLGGKCRNPKRALARNIIYQNPLNAKPKPTRSLNAKPKPSRNLNRPKA